MAFFIPWRVVADESGAAHFDLLGPPGRAGADFHFSDIPVRGDDGARAIGANDDAAAVELRGRRRRHPGSKAALTGGGAMLLDLPGPALRLLTDVADFHFRGPRIIATDRQAPRIYPRMIRLCSRFDSVLFTPKMSAIPSYGNYSRSPLVIFRFGATMELGRSERTTMRPLWSYGVDGANTPDRKPR
jgi:hypothetical protein